MSETFPPSRASGDEKWRFVFDRFEEREGGKEKSDLCLIGKSHIDDAIQTCCFEET